VRQAGHEPGAVVELGGALELRARAPERARAALEDRQVDALRGLHADIAAALDLLDQAQQERARLVHRPRR
jgi:hypothetical protein